LLKVSAEWPVGASRHSLVGWVCKDRPAPGPAIPRTAPSPGRHWPWSTRCVRWTRPRSGCSARSRTSCAIGYLELLTDQTLGPITPEQDRVLRTVAHSMARLAAMIDELAPTEPGDRG